MTKIVQEVGGSAANQDAYTGEVRQVTVDTDNWDIRLHDGVTPGGRRLVNRDNGDARWQAKSDELTGFDFNPEQRGFLVRQATGQYKIRVFLFDEEVFGIANPDGYNGNPLLTLNTEIVGDRQFTGDVIITGVAQVDGGINANLSGDTAGTHTGPVVGPVTGDVTGDLTGDSAGTHTGPVNVSGQTLTLDDEQIPAAKVAGLATFMAEAVPHGVIWIWSGSAASIPTGFELCNGLNGTPNLTDRFIVGAGSLDYDPGDTGGAATHTHANTIDNGGVHSHTLTIAGHSLTVGELPAHAHTNGVCDNITTLFNHGTVAASPTTSGAIESNGSTGTTEGNTSTVGSGTAHTHAGSTADSGGSHSHTLNNVAASSLPPYYALCYIMRVVV
jgi:hypothetical protein